jgi:hypothetical protein
VFARFSQSRGGHLCQDEDTLFEVIGMDGHCLIDDGESLEYTNNGLLR